MAISRERRGLAGALVAVAACLAAQPALFQQAEDLRNSGQWEQAIARYTEVAVTTLDRPQAARAHYRIAQVYEQLNDPDAALIWYGSSLERARYPETEAAIRRLRGERFGKLVTAVEITRGLNLPATRSQGISPAIDLPVNFDYDSDTLTDTGATQVAELARAMADLVFAHDRFLLLGHTDQHGTDAYNQALSARRAARVKDVLQKRYAVDGARLDVQGLGKSRLLYPGGAEEDDRLNRRVEVKRLKDTYPPPVN